MKQSRKSSGRLILKSDFAAVRELGRKQVCFLAVMLYAGPDPKDVEPSARCGVICSRKFDKRAVRRNRARRLLHEAFRLTERELTPCRIIFIPRRAILNMKMQDVAHQLERLFRKAGLLQTSPK
ncbi:MAG: ribonuclease P protein component [Lentisphaeria bacterium]|nr:ribonuclease P protein component [Lentisphaeria bacterium]